MNVEKIPIYIKETEKQADRKEGKKGQTAGATSLQRESDIDVTETRK